MSVGFEATEMDRSVHLTSSFDLTREILIFSVAGPATEAWNMEASENSSFDNSGTGLSETNRNIFFSFSERKVEAQKKRDRD